MNKQRHLSRKNKHKKKKIIFTGITLLLSVVLFIGSYMGYTYWKVNQFLNEASENNGDTPLNMKNTVKKAEEEKETSFGMLIIGEDYRIQTGSRNTDAIIVSIWNPTTKEISLLSIPRDTKVDIPGFGSGKINSVFAKGEKVKHQQEANGEQPTISGATLMMETLSDLLDIPITAYVKVDFQGFIDIIDTLDGIKVDVERDMYYVSEADNTYINLKKGLQELDGKKALDYARFRRSSNGNDSNDFERNERHQTIIKAIANKAISVKGVFNIGEILDVAGEHIKTNLSPEEMKNMIWTYKGINLNSIQTIKMNSYWQNPYVYVDKEELDRIQNTLKNAFNKTKQ